MSDAQVQHNINFSGTMYLPTPSAVALWHCEVSGQISDGMWENSTPRNHWVFWVSLDLKLDRDRKPVVIPSPGHRPLKNNYSLQNLHRLRYPSPDDRFILRERMIGTGRMARAGANMLNRNVCELGEFLPETFEEFKSMRAADRWPGYDAQKHIIANIDPELIKNYYATRYTLKDLNNDLKLISEAMKSVKIGK